MKCNCCRSRLVAPKLEDMPYLMQTRENERLLENYLNKEGVNVGGMRTDIRDLTASSA